MHPVAGALVVFTCAVFLSACSDEDSKPPETPAPPAYDGPWAPLAEEGDWQDRGAYAPCSDIWADRATICTNVNPRTRPGCEPGTLGGLERQGAIYQTLIRIERPSRNIPDPEWRYLPDDNSGFLFDSSGQPVLVMQGRPIRSQFDAQTFFAVGQHVGESSSRYYLFDGCKATGPRSLTGCFVECLDDKFQRFGSFRSERMTWREGEAESSGDLPLVSESFVERGKPADVHVTKGHAYVVSIDRPGRPGGLTVFEVRDRRAPVKVATYWEVQESWDSYWNDVESKGDALYVAAEAGVRVYDISDPGKPVFRNVAPGPRGEIHTLFVEGDRLYAMAVATKAAMVFDISEPLQPQLITSYSLPGLERDPSLGIARANNLHDAFAYEGRLYINALSDGLAVVDVSALPAAPLLGRYVYPYAFSHTTVVGTFNGRTIAFEGGETNSAHLRVLDVTNPANIVKIGEYRLRELTSIHNMVLVGTRLYVAWYHEGVRVLDVSDPSQPRQVAHFNTYRETDPHREDRLFEGAIGMHVPGDGYVYVVETARGLMIFEQK